MSMDYQKTTYRRRLHQDTKKQTSYSLMNQWYTTDLGHAHAVSHLPLPAQQTIPAPPHPPGHDGLLEARLPSQSASEHQSRRAGRDRKHAWSSPTQDESKQVETDESDLNHPIRPSDKITESPADKVTGRPFDEVTERPADKAIARVGDKNDKAAIRRFVTAQAKTTRYQAEQLRIMQHQRPEVYSAVIQGEPVHTQYSRSGGYDDFHKAYLKIQSTDGVKYPRMGPPRLRNGGMGSSWRHVKQVLQAKGARTLFIDGGPRIVDNWKLTHGEVPGGNALQQTHLTAGLNHKATQRCVPPKNLGSHALQAHLGTEKSNWLLMR